MYRLGIDIGGTFTDAVLLNEETGEARDGPRCRPTPDDLSRGFLNAVHRILADRGVSPTDVGYLVHATTRRYQLDHRGKDRPHRVLSPPTAFRDMLEIARQIRPSLYDLQFREAAALGAPLPRVRSP